MVIKRYAAQRFSGLEADVASLPIDPDLEGAIFNSSDTLEFWIFDGTVWKKTLQPSPLTTKGDIYTRDITQDAALAVGNDGQRLEADAAEATGLKWVDPSTSPDPTFDTVTLNRIAPPIDPAVNTSVEYLKQIDADNDAKAIKMKVNGSIVEVRFF